MSSLQRRTSDTPPGGWKMFSLEACSSNALGLHAQLIYNVNLIIGLTFRFNTIPVISLNNLICMSS